MRELAWVWAGALLAVAAGCGSSDEPAAEDGQGGEGAGAPASVDYVIVAADPLAASAERFRQYRAATGHNVDLVLMSEVTAGAADSEAAVGLIRSYVLDHYQAAERDPADPMFLLLLGDTDETWSGGPAMVPTGSYADSYDPAPVTSDNAFADLDGDLVPDIAVGRIPAASDAEVDGVRAKVEAHESGYAAGPWNKRINLFASTAGMGETIDSVIESLAFSIVESMSYDFDMTMTYASQESPFVYVPEQFSDQVYERINEGSMLVSYIGHGYEDGFARLEWNGSSYPILDTDELDKLAVRNRAPMLSIIACLTGAFDTGESISERILKAADAPVAILSSTEISHPYPNAIFIYELGLVVTEEHAPTVGQAFQRAKERLVENQDAMRELIEELGKLMLPEPERASLQRTHLHMYALFGDPAMRVGYPRFAEAVAVEPTEAAAGSAIAVTAEFAAPPSGQATVTLESQRSIILGEVQEVPPDGDPDRDAVIESNYALANDKVVVSAEVLLASGAVSATLAIPADLPPDDYAVKIYVQEAAVDAVGSALLTVVADE